MFDSLLKRVHRVEPPNLERTVPMEVLSLGISRSGTESMREALINLGYSHCYHGFSIAEGRAPDMVAWDMAGESKFHHQGQNPPLNREFFDKILGDCRAVSDMPAIAFSRELILAYPEAKVILNKRPVDPWYKSMLKAIGPMEKMDPLLRFFHSDLYWLHKGFFQTTGRGFFRGHYTETGRWLYEEHAAMIKGLVPQERLLEWNLGDGWEPLCKFLGKPIPDEPFPNGNAGDEFYERLEAILKDAKSQAWRAFGFAGTGVVVAIAAVVSGIRFYA